MLTYTDLNHKSFNFRHPFPHFSEMTGTEEVIYEMVETNKKNLFHSIVKKSYNEFQRNLMLMQSALNTYCHSYCANFYKKNQGMINNSNKEMQIETCQKKVYSEFFQHLIYCIVHNANDLTFSEKSFFLKEICNLELFIYVNVDGCVLHDLMPNNVLWIDPKEKNNILNVMSRGGFFDIIKILILKVEKAVGGKNTKRFRDFLMNRNKCGFTALHSASKEGNHEIVKTLINAAEKAFDGKKTQGFHDFLTNKNNYEVAILHSASKEGNHEIVKTLIHAAEEAFGGKKTRGFHDFLTNRDFYGHTARGYAFKAGFYEIVKTLDHAEEEAFDRNNIRIPMNFHNKNGHQMKGNHSNRTPTKRPRDNSSFFSSKKNKLPCRKQRGINPQGIKSRSDFFPKQPKVKDQLSPGKGGSSNKTDTSISNSAKANQVLQRFFLRNGDGSFRYYRSHSNRSRQKNRAIATQTLNSGIFSMVSSWSLVSTLAQLSANGNGINSMLFPM